MRILIIGSNSFLAKNFIDKYSKNIKFFYFDLYFSNNSKEFLKKIYQYVNKKKIKHIINFIGNNDNSLFPHKADHILRDNFILPLNLISLFKKKKINFTLFSSVEINKIENPNENSIYSLSKYFLSEALRFLRTKNKISLIKMDTVFGPHDLNFNRLIPALMLKILIKKKNIKLKLSQKKRLVYVNEILPIVLKTTVNKKSIDIINIKGKNYDISNLWKNINKSLLNKYTVVAKNKNFYNFIETFEWYKNNLWMIKKIIKKYHNTI